MATASVNFVAIRLVEETTYGSPTLPGGAYQAIRFTSSTLGHEKNTVVSNTIRSDRQRTDLLEVSISASGQLDFELAHGADFTQFAQGIMMANWNSATTGASTIDITGATPASGAASLTGTGTTFVTDGFVDGQFIKLTGYATGTNNNSIRRIRQVDSETSIILEDPDDLLTTEIGGGDEQLDGNTIRNGGSQTYQDLLEITADHPFEENSYVIEIEYTDISVFQVLDGMEMDRWSFDINAEAIITCSTQWVGQEVAQLSQDSASETAAPSTTPMTASANVGQIAWEEAGVLTTASICIRRIQFEINNNLRRQPRIGNKTPCALAAGFLDVTGTIEAYFENTTAYNDMINHTDSSLEMVLTDVDGNVIAIFMPRISWSEGNPQVPGGNDDVILPLGFTAIRDSVTGFTIQFDDL